MAQHINLKQGLHTEYLQATVSSVSLCVRGNPRELALLFLSHPEVHAGKWSCGYTRSDIYCYSKHMASPLTLLYQSRHTDVKWLLKSFSYSTII